MSQSGYMSIRDYIQLNPELEDAEYFLWIVGWVLFSCNAMVLTGGRV